MLESTSFEIRPITVSGLPACLEVIRISFMTVAEEFGLTEENCPTNGAFMKIDRLVNDFDKGDMMYGAYTQNILAGFMQLGRKDQNTYELRKLSVLPEYRHNSCGRQLLAFAANRVRELGGNLMTIGIIEENARLKQWYLANGFTHTGTSVFPHLPFTVGFMEMKL